MKDRYQITETSSSFSFKPHHHHRRKFKWYVLGMLLFSMLSLYFSRPMDEPYLIISTVVLVLIAWFFVKTFVFYMPIRYTFDKSANAVYQTHLFVVKKKIMHVDDVVIYQSSEMGSWRYKMGKRRSQFLKSYAISEFFSDNKDSVKLKEFESEILSKIEQMIASKA